MSPDLTEQPSSINRAIPPVAHDTSLDILERLHLPVWIFDIDRRHIYWANREALEIWNASSLEELQARNMAIDMTPAVAARLEQYQHDFIEHDAQFSEVWTLYPKGRSRTLRVVFSGYRLNDGRMAMFCECLGDQPGSPDTLRSIDALNHTTVMITLLDSRGRALYRNRAAREAVPNPLASTRASFVDTADFRKLLHTLATDGQARIVARIKTTRGERWHEISARMCHDVASGDTACLVSESDVTELKQTEARAQHLAQHDLLTGLPNRNFVLDGFSQRLRDIQMLGQEAALMFIDLDRFKNINDTLGHAAGDTLLVQMSNRLRTVMRGLDMVARLGGDEFLVLAASASIAEHVALLGNRILQALSQPLIVSNTEIQMTCSIGVSLFPADGEDIGTLMRHADLAMYRAKDLGKNQVAYFSPELNAEAQNRMSIENELRMAIDTRQFEVFYQPRINVRNNLVQGAEALVRWRHPTRGLLYPDAFIDICEETNLISQLGMQIFEQVAYQQVSWREAGWDLRISLNLSARQLADPAFLDTVKHILRRSTCQPQKLELEITESTLLGNSDQTLEVLATLHEMGFTIAIDDFGTGYSNLGYLQKYPISCLKIDRSFIQSLDSTHAIAELIINMSRLLKVAMVAEGVETEAQLAWLQERECEEYQGFLFSKAVPVQEFESLLIRGELKSALD